MEIEKHIAFANNNLASFRKKWATFKQCPSGKYFFSIQLMKVQVTNGQIRDGGPNGRQPSLDCLYINYSIFVDFVFFFS